MKAPPTKVPPAQVRSASTSRLAGAAALIASFALGGCVSHHTNPDAHWSSYSIGPRVGRAFVGYDAERDGPDYIDFQWEKKKNLNLTLRRHFLNSNPDNPFQAAPKNYPPKRPVHSIVPHPEYYINWEGLAMGAIIYAGGGIFLPIPVDSVIGTASPGGGDEFMRGIDQTTRPIGVISSSFLYDGVGIPTKEEQAERAARSGK